MAIRRLLKSVFNEKHPIWFWAGAAVTVVTLAGFAVAGVLFLIQSDEIGKTLGTKVELWHAIAGVLVLGFIWVVLRTVTRADDKPRLLSVVWRGCPPEVAKYGVLWPISTISDGSRPTEFRPGKPMCPTHRSTLGWRVRSEIDGKESTVPLQDSWWQSMGAHHLVLVCFNDDETFNLTSTGDMADLVAAVESLAWGEYRTVQRTQKK